MEVCADASARAAVEAAIDQLPDVCLPDVPHAGERDTGSR